MSFPPCPAHQWVFRARLMRVIDGDTAEFLIDTAFRTTRTERVRLLGIDTPEMRGLEREAGLAARTYAARWYAVQPKTEWPFLLATRTDPDSFGRYLAYVYAAETGECLNGVLLLAGMAKEYDQ